MIRCVFAVIVAVSLVMKDCCDPPEEGGVVEVTATYKRTTQCDIDDCIHFYELSYKDPERGDHWYWATIERGEDTATLDMWGRYANGGTQTREIPVHYFQCTAGKSYFINVYQCDSRADVFNVGKAKSSGNTNLVTIPAFGDECQSKCCTNDSTDFGFYYVQMEKKKPDISGIRAFLGTRYANICREDEGYNDTLGHSCAYISLMRLDENGLKTYVENGYRRYRKRDGTIAQGWFAQFAWDGWPRWELSIEVSPFVPAEGHSYSYETVVDTNTGRFSLAFNDTQIPYDTVISQWTTAAGTSAIWAGEVYGRESDMPGLDSSSYSCNFEACMYRVRSGWIGAGFMFDLYDLDRWNWYPNEWGMQVVSDLEFKIWDKKPLP